MKKIIQLSCTCAALIMSSVVQADGFSMSVGGDYSTGKYGTSDKTNVFYMPIVGSYVTGSLSFRINVPYIRVTGPGDFVPGGLSGSGGGSTIVTTTNNCRSINSGSGSSGGSGNGQKICDTITTVIPGPPPVVTPATRTRNTESGIGDVTLSAMYNVLDNADWAIDLTGKVKLPTGSESKGLGNGETDYALQANVDKYFGATYASLGLGYRWLGEPAGVKYDNIVYGSVGGGYKFSDKTSAGISYDWATAAVDGGSKPQELSVYASTYLNNNYKLSGVLYTGLSDASPDVGGGLTLSYYFQDWSFPPNSLAGNSHSECLQSWRNLAY